MSHSYVLEQVDIFEDLSPSQLDMVEKICKEHNLNRGEVVFEENSPSREFYIITDGEVEIQIDPDTIGDGTDAHEPTTIAILRRGQSFGEVAIIDPGVRSASARCRSETCRLLEINRDDFVSLLESDFQIGYIVMRNFAVDLSLKIRQTNLLVRESLM
ncbi:MAG TPA: cyclic nucleotide-binding domain-containing protein [Anaerolineae bacterium]|nr:cyclic nucleotide-binding domain-containing protein [Anaerolineae bacterium]MCB0181329.1 cyclic nucleotide-binding domain-containing protein [Anaerolineae bacterium]MCB0223621.1 cyclic nucleotide-binding domain-containing protein [Anaerolineae bacterium]MCB9106016.1 cyclic nucleotide-binding domain-containing protein [Anaerolineales bacterium]HRV95294.1 cyclic nucleotide-binding domain-containing protein [Anaerolineae bacterium]